MKFTDFNKFTDYIYYLHEYEYYKVLKDNYNTKCTLKMGRRAVVLVCQK